MSTSLLDARRPRAADVLAYLGNNDAGEAAREIGAQLLQEYPPIRDAFVACREFRARAVRIMEDVWGVDQFVIIGSGYLSPWRNVHDFARAIDRDSRCLYVDDDPRVVASIATRPASNRPGVVNASTLHADALLAGVSHALDLDQPMGVFLALDYVPPQNAGAIVAALSRTLYPGSRLMLTAATSLDPLISAWNGVECLPLWHKREARDLLRLIGSRDELALCGPGPVDCARWQSHQRKAPALSGFSVAVARVLRKDWATP